MNIRKILEKELNKKMLKTKGENPDVASHRGGYNARIIENWELWEKIKDLI